ncbi:MAG: hypothetical protein MR606_04730 [Mollicutes bacterium]|nr:hypothetical protein [Mollicutes bacterium]MDD7264073.1 hypothetical protein [bacterium]MDY4979656.1 hypothetical protein [Candidatus Onthovivens sp.]
MKRTRILTLSSVLLFSYILTGCGNNPQPVEKVATIILRSKENQSLKVGEGMTIVYSVVNSNSKVIFKSENENIVTCNEYGEVKAINTGKTVVTLSLEENPSIKKTINFDITRNFFKTENGFVNGTVDLSKQEDSSVVYIKDGQAQVLADLPGTEWYFKTHIDRTGFTESIGGWGVGSFLVNDTNRIGDVMFWYCLRRANDDNHAKLFYGGWRYDLSVSNSKEELVSNEVIDISKGVDFTIYRKGIKHYLILEYKDGEVTKTIKHTYDVPLFLEQNTYPGVFGQNQKLTISSFEGSNESKVVDEKLESFQLAEAISINVIDNRFVKGRTYKLTSTILPSYTINKEVEYSLNENYEGITLSSDGVLTISKDTKVNEISVKAISKSNKNTSDLKTFSLINEDISKDELVNTNLTIGNPTISEGVIKTSNNDSYIPFNKASKSWYVETDITLSEASVNKEFGILSSSEGYSEYVKYSYKGSFSKNSNLYINELNGDETMIRAGANGSLASLTNKIGLLRKDNVYYLFSNNKMIKKFESNLNDVSYPVFYSQAKATFSNYSYTSEENKINEILDNNDFFTGSYVNKVDNKYTLQSMDLGSQADINWPPVNDYLNGIKYKEAINQNFEISFTLSDIKPLVLGNGDIDAKVLVYLKSERVTSSLQFVIKNYDGVRKVKFTANLNDATWTEYELPSGYDLLNNQTDIKIVRTDTEVQLYLNNNRVFEGEKFMKNSNYWGKKTIATPGIGTFKCGATITNPKVTLK